MALSTIKGCRPKILAFHKENLELKAVRSGDCWLWQGSMGWDGYGVTKFDGANITLHRLSFLINKGDIPKGLVVRHTCDNRRCVNPEHLVLGSRGDNNRDTAVRRTTGRRGGPQRVDSLRFATTEAIASDAMIRLLWSESHSAGEIAQHMKLPIEHVQEILKGNSEASDRRPLTRFEKRYWIKVDKGQDCWIWTAMRAYGYGKLRVGSTNVGAHVLSWRLHRGVIAEGLVVCHDCPAGDNPACVRPDHLFLQSQTENMRDAARKRLRMTCAGHIKFGMGDIV